MIKNLLVLILLSSKLIAQNHNNVWVFGDSAGIDFNNGAIPIITGMDGRGSCVSYSDSTGSLMIYTFTRASAGAWTTHIFNSTNVSVVGADSITGSGWYSELALLPKPGDNSGNIFYVFSIGVTGSPNPGLYYTLIDMGLNGGLGGVLQENIQIDNINYGDCLTLVKHGNGRDWWVITKINNFPFTFYNRFRTYLVTNDSIHPCIVQSFNDASDVGFQKICWHPSINKFMLINTRGYMSEFNFDRCNGAITLNQNIFPEQSSNFNRPFWEGAYSPNGNIFYVSRTSYGGNYGDYNYLLQYDLTSTDIPASCDTLDSTLYPPVDCGALRLAPDGKIYYSQAYISQSVLSYPYADSMYNYINQNLGVINNPDVIGSGCNFSPFSFYLGGKRTYYGLPNNPNYSLGPLIGSPCDTLSTGISAVHQAGALIMPAPNPSSKVIYFNAQRVRGKAGVISICNSLGLIVFKKAIEVYSGGYATQHIDVSGFCNGVYFITLKTEKEIISAKFVKN